MIVGDDDFRAVEIAEHVPRNQLAAPVVAVGVIRLEHPEPIPDGETGGDHEKSARESAAAGAAHRVHGLPCNEHGHDRRLSGAGRELEGEPGEARVRLLVRGREEVEEAAPLSAETWRHFGEPDHSLHRLGLAEEGPDAAEAVAAPVSEKSGRLGGHAPFAGVRNRPPRVDPAAEVVDDLHQIVLLARGLQRLGHRVKDDLALAPLLRLGDRGDEGCGAAMVDEPTRRLAALIELPVSCRVLVGRVEDRALEELGVHVAVSLSFRISADETAEPSGRGRGAGHTAAVAVFDAFTSWSADAQPT